MDHHSISELRGEKALVTRRLSSREAKTEFWKIYWTNSKIHSSLQNWGHQGPSISLRLSLSGINKTKSEPNFSLGPGSLCIAGSWLVSGNIIAALQKQAESGDLGMAWRLREFSCVSMFVSHCDFSSSDGVISQYVCWETRVPCICNSMQWHTQLHRDL